MAENSPVYVAVEKVTGLFDLKDVKIFSYKKDFETLWSSLGTDGGELPQTAVVVWDGTPSGDSGPVNVRSYLTPLDWAVGLSLWKKGAFFNSRIIILDTGSEHMDGLECWRGNVELMPWVRVCRLGDRRDFICTLLDGFPTMKASFDNKKQPDMNFMRNLWSARLTRPSVAGDHHALANLIGPLLLTGTDVHPHVKKLRNLTEAIGLLPKSEPKSGAWINLSEWVSKLGGKALNLILIDDMWWHAGWGKMLCSVVGATYVEPNNVENETGPVKIGSTPDGKVVVKASSSADWILEKLERASTTDQRFSFFLDSEENTLEILFLDLRLFTGKNIKEEALFFEKLSRVAVKFKEDGNKNLPWPGFITKKAGDVKEVEGWITLAKNTEDPSGEREKDAYIAALTILPRLLALTDMSLPIVLFSSTGKRDIIEKLKHYGNIITDFDKPKFTVDIPVDIAEQSRGKFQEAMRKALDLCRARLFIDTIRSVSPIKRPDKKYSHFEIYIDESGEPEKGHFVVGGLLVGYDNEADARGIHDGMEQSGIIWYGNGTKLEKELSQKDLTGKVLQPLSIILNDRPVVPFMFFRYPPPVRPNDPTDLLHPDAIDNMFLSLLKTALEVSIFESAPELASDPTKFSVSVFVATRKRYNDSLVQRDWERLYEKFGIQASAYGQRIVKGGYCNGMAPFDLEDVSLINSSGNYDETGLKRKADNKTGHPVPNHYQTISSDSIYTIISEVLSMRQSDIQLEIKNAAGVMLAYWKKPSQYKSFRHIHYVADYVARCANLDYMTNEISNKVFSSWDPSTRTGLCTIERRDEALLNTIDASRRLEAGDLVGALLQVALSRSKDESIISRIVKGRINPSLNKMKGIDFLRFSWMLRELTDASQPLKKLPPMSKPSSYVDATIKIVPKKNDAKGSCPLTFGVLDNGTMVIIPVKVLKKQQRFPKSGEKIKLEYMKTDKGLLATKMILSEYAQKSL